ncbi:MAG: twin-arginine translocation signal domain-containing protein [Planctomycetes bacterium]|nr:twin-arginine translocation signal domain-containing protein [Planctomycetota bacterium]
MNRRDFLRLSALAAGTALLTGVYKSGAFSGVFAADGQGQTMNRKTLTVYFSKTGNTKTIADLIQARVGGDQFRVVTVEPYPEDYRQTTQKARVELDSNMRPAIVGNVENMDSYDTVFIGYPNWWGTIPMALFTFLEGHDLTSKTVIPFCTHEGSGLGRGPDDIRRLCPNATVMQGLAVRGSSVNRAENDVAEWLRRIGVTR